MRKIMIIILIISIILFSVLLNTKNILKAIYRQDYSEYVEKYAKENNIDSLLVYAIIKAESNFEITASSNKGAKGLMQLLDETANEVAQNELIEYKSEETLYNPEKNIMLGVKYYATLKEQLNNNVIALAAYNAGIGTVTKWIEQGIIKADGSDIENIPYKETNMYVRKILRDYAMYKKLYT